MTFTLAHRGGAGPPLVLLHGFTGTWRMWELVLPALERHHDVLAPTLAGHAGGPPVDAPVRAAALADAVERAMDAAGFETAHLAGNSLGGYVALDLAARGRARSVVALAPAGGWAAGDGSYHEALDYFLRLKELMRTAAPRVDAIVATPEGRRRATQDITTNFEHIPAELIAHMMLGIARCEVLSAAVENAREHGWPLDPEPIGCPLRFVWGSKDRLLEWPAAAARYRAWFPRADWIELDGIGHCPQLDVPLEAAELILGFTRQPHRRRALR